MSDLLRGLFAQRDAAMADYEYVAAVYRQACEAGTPPDDYTAAYNEHRSRVEELDARILEVEAEETRKRQIDEARVRAGIDTVPTVVVREEPRTYGPGSPNSYFADLCWAAMPGDPHFRDAQERLVAHGREVVRDCVNDVNARKRVVRLAREHYRKDEARGRQFISDIEARALEVRAMDTTAASGGSFVTPEYLVSEYAPFRQFGRVFIDQANVQPLPEYGMTVYLPHVTGPAGVASQSSQNAGITETDPTAGYLSANLVTEAGQVTVSQQLLDRAGPGIQFDRIVFDQLQRAYNQAIDTAVLTAALANAGTVTDAHTTATGAAVIQDLYSDVATAAQQMETATGTVLSPTHLFATPTEWAFVSSQLDSNGRPLVVPSAGGPFNAIAAAIAGKEAVVPEGATGYELLSLPVFKDGNIPTTNAGADTQIVVAHMPEVWVWEGEPVPRTIPQTFAQNLSVLLQLYAYYTVIVRYPAAVQSITGARYPVSPTFIYS